MRLLYLDVNMGYMNPTRALVPAMLRECAETVLYGPGYQPPTVLRSGLAAFVDREGPFDFVVGNEFSAEVIPLRLKYHAMRASAESLDALRDVVPWFARHAGRKIVLLLECDVFHLSQSQISRLQDTGAWYAPLWDRRLMESVRDSHDLPHEPHAARANDNFFNFIVANDERTITLPWFVADGEFAWGAMSDRDPEWNVPGATYHYRKWARGALAREGLLQRHFPWMRSYALLSRLGVNVYTNWALLNLYGAQFSHAIEGTRYCYTCGSAQHMHVRKHFEIPAKGALLVTAPVLGLEAMGFLDGVNCFVRMPHELVALHRELERDPERTRSIASAGRELIWSTHRLSNRAQQLRASLEAICRGQFAGSHWERGEWTIQNGVTLS